MFRYFFQKFFFQIILIGALVGFFGVFVFAFKLDTINRPPKSVPPDIAAAAGKPVVQGMSENASRLSQQHMSSAEISLKLSEIVAETLSFNAQNFRANSAAMEKYFTADGYKQYRDFLSSSAIETTVTQQNLQSAAYPEEDPLELAKGVYNNAYKWVFEVPVVLSFIPRNSETYRNDVIKAVNRRFTLRVQFARVQDEDPNAIKVELWQILPPRPKPKLP